MTKRPNWGNPMDACCACGRVQNTPKDSDKPGAEELGVWQPNDSDPAQWICTPCKQRLTADARRVS